MKRIAFLTLGLALATGLFVAAGAFGGSAYARGSRPAVVKAGTCTGNSTSTLKVKPDDSGTEVEFEVDQNRNGATWRVTLRNDGVAFFQGNRVTRAPSGSFTVQARTQDGPGLDRIAARARNLKTGEVCTALVRI